MLTLLYRSIGLATAIQRTIILWFIAIKDDYKTIEVENIGTWSILLTLY